MDQCISFPEEPSRDAPCSYESCIRKVQAVWREHVGVLLATVFGLAWIVVLLLRLIQQEEDRLDLGTMAITLLTFGIALIMLYQTIQTQREERRQATFEFMKTLIDTNAEWIAQDRKDKASIVEICRCLAKAREEGAFDEDVLRRIYGRFLIHLRRSVEIQLGTRLEGRRSDFNEYVDLLVDEVGEDVCNRCGEFKSAERDFTDQPDSRVCNTCNRLMGEAVNNLDQVFAAVMQHVNGKRDPRICSEGAEKLVFLAAQLLGDDRRYLLSQFLGKHGADLPRAIEYFQDREKDGIVKITDQDDGVKEIAAILHMERTRADLGYPDSGK